MVPSRICVKVCLAENMNLLVVEADPGVSLSLADQFSELGYASLSASNLNSAVRMCDHAHPELIVCDRFEWSEALASQYRYIPVALAASELSTDLLFKAMRAGLADVWRMPGDATELGERVSDLLRRSKAVEGQMETRLNQFVRDLRSDQRAGRLVQLGMLPPNPMAIDHYRLEHRIVPSLILSGDFVDYFRVNERHFAFYVADVSGHGASSAFVTVLLKNLSRRLRREYRPSMMSNPGEILQWLNHELLDQHMDKHVVLLIAICDLETDTVRFANAGHYPPMAFVSKDETRFLNLKGKPIGLFDTVNYEVLALDLSVGDRLVILTDGVLESLPHKSLEDKERHLLEVIRDNESVEELWCALELADTEEAHGSDDVTCLMVTREH